VETAGLSLAWCVSPWCQPFSDELALFQQGFSHRELLNALTDNAAQRQLRNANGQPITFADADSVSADMARTGTAYESWIFKTGQVPTRPHSEAGWHDLFNAVVWLAYPKSKALLNRFQAEAIARDGVGMQRGSLRDAITLLDESAILLASCAPDIVQSLKEHHWNEALVERRDQWGKRIQPSLFGHAVLQKLVDPYKSLCAHSYVLEVDPSYFTLAPDAQRAVLDRKLHSQLESDNAAGHLANKPFSPLPVLGIPFWSAQNSQASFYADKTVFRPKS
jgi:Protein of unknown function (DUF3025)